MRHAVRFLLFLIVSSALPLYAQSSVKELNEAGWKALETGNGRRALSLFNEALALRPDDPVLLTGAGDQDDRGRVEARARRSGAHFQAGRVEAGNENPQRLPGGALRPLPRHV